MATTESAWNNPRFLYCYFHVLVRFFIVKAEPPKPAAVPPAPAPPPVLSAVPPATPAPPPVPSSGPPAPPAGGPPAPPGGGPPPPPPPPPVGGGPPAPPPPPVGGPSSGGVGGPGGAGGLAGALKGVQLKKRSDVSWVFNNILNILILYPWKHYKSKDYISNLHIQITIKYYYNSHF